MPQPSSYSSLHLGTPKPESNQPSRPGDNLNLSLDLLDDNPFQPRGAMDEGPLEELVASIARHGLLQAITVRRVADRFQVIAGHRSGNELVGVRIPFYDPTSANAPPLGALKVAATRLSDDRRTLRLATDPLPFRASYRAILPGIRAGEPNDPIVRASGPTSQLRSILSISINLRASAGAALFWSLSKYTKTVRRCRRHPAMSRAQARSVRSE